MEIEELYISLIVRYLKDEASGEEKKKLFEWAYSNPENEKLFYNLKDIWETAKYRQVSEKASTGEEWEKFALKAISEGSQLYINNKIRVKKLYRAIQIAAAIILTFAIGFFIQKYLPEKQTYATVKVPYGAKSEVELPDGSHVWVNSGSSLKYPAKLEGKDVFLYLNGEAFFDIVKNPKRRINVQTSTINIQVLGTTFNVKSYDDEGIVETTLVKGLISITGKVGNKTIEPILLKPNEQARLIKGLSEIIVEEKKDKTEEAGNTGAEEPITGHKQIKPALQIAAKVDIEPITSWKDNKMVFKNERFEELAKKMERWFNVKIQIEDDGLRDSRYTGVFEKETIEQAMAALSMSLPFTYRIEKNEIQVIKRK